ncbi:hypothetical protein BGZ94_007590, partial [Podila epigama]
LKSTNMKFTVFAFVFALIFAIVSQANAVCWCVDRARSKTCVAEWCGTSNEQGWKCLNGDADGFASCCNSAPKGQKKGYLCH